jgi:Fe-S-cluster-containing hydrogenase component 2
MTEQDIYERLREHLDGMPVGYPRTKSGVELRLLRRLFTEEEAEMAIILTPFPATAAEVAERMGQEAAKVEALLDQMSAKGLIFNSRKGGIATYQASWFLIGIFDYQVNRMTKEFTKDFDQYVEEGFRNELFSVPTQQLRVVPVNKAVDTATKTIAPYDDARELIKQQSIISVRNCVCRQKEELQEGACSRTQEMELCLAFSTGAYYFIEHGLAREITQDAALNLLDLAEEKGLVLSPGNAQKTFSICLCCGDCCEFLKNLKKMPKPSSFVDNNYHAQVDAELCASCETCISRCQMDAISYVDDIATIDLDQCVGCGLCVTTCPEGALSMHRKVENEHIVPPANVYELYMKIGAERMQRESS